MVTGEMSCVQYLLFFFNLLFVVSGIALISIGGVTWASISNYTGIFDWTTIPLILIVVGVIVFVVALFGCCGAAKRNHCMIITFAVFLLIIFTLELAAGIAGYVSRNEVDGVLNTSFNKSLDEYPKNLQIQKTWDVVQNDFQCCGIHDDTDWFRVFGNDSLPYTCCKDHTKETGCNRHSENVYHNGCFENLKEYFENKAYVIGGVGVGIALFQLLGVIFSCVLARSIRKEYETV